MTRDYTTSIWRRPRMFAYRSIGLCLTLLLLLVNTTPTTACTSFTLDDDGDLFFVHSINQGSMERIDGSAYINPRHVWKNGYSFSAYTEVGNTSAPDLVWQSTYGSVTFSPLGLEYPDGGLNEAGLFIWEMGYDSEYSQDDTLPILFQMQWMQYQLDNFATVDDVLAHLDKVALDGWGWHYFVADKSGRAAIIDYENGQPVVYTGDDLPLPICCNSKYPVAMNYLRQHQGFGGELEITQNFDEIPRFIYGAKLYQEFDDQDPVSYGLKMLDDMSTNVRWSIVFDVENTTAYFKTNIDQTIRHFEFSKGDFNPADGPRRLDINTSGAEDLHDAFVPCDSAYEHALLENFMHYFVEDPADRAAVIQSMVARKQYAEHGPELIGTWTGTLRVPSNEDWLEIPVTLELKETEDGLAGILNDKFHTDHVVSNLRSYAGLLEFTTFRPTEADLFHYQLHVGRHAIRGGVRTWDWYNQKVAKLELRRQE